MKKLFFVLFVFVLVPEAPAQEVTISTAEDQQSVSLTIYNQNFAVVREQRSIALEQGLNVVRFEGVAALIDPTSISFKSLTAPNGVRVQEQNYQYDLLGPQSILEKSVGQRIRLRQVFPDGVVRTWEGVLLSQPSQGTVVQLDDGRILLNPLGQIELDTLPEGLVSRPSLLGRLQADRGGAHDTEVAYMTEGITWNADYVVIVDQDETHVDLTCWVTLDNQSGATYRQAQLQLMAGDVRRIQQDPRIQEYAALRRGDRQEPFEEEAFFEYHLYTLQGTTTVRNKETKQMALLTAADVSVQRRLIFDGMRRWWIRGAYRPGAGGDTQQGKLNIVLELANTQDNNMGMALPKGKVRVYKADAQNRLQFLGEDLIDHTPRNETVRLYIGDAFDVVGERKRTVYRRPADNLSEETYEITIRNHKEEPARVWVVEHFYGDWEILRNSHDYTRLDAHTVEFPLTVPADGEVQVVYEVRTRQ